jgi:hypothetical protein
MRSDRASRLKCPRRTARLLLAIALCAGVASLATSSLGASSSAAAPAPHPTATTGDTSNVTYSSAILYGSVNASGQATNYLFQYGTTRAYGSQTPLSPAGNRTITIKVSQALSGLQPLTTYHYRIVAIGPTGTALGRDRTFTTVKIPLSVAIVGVPNPVLFGSPFLVEGTLSGTGSANHAVELQANTFPYLGGFKVIGNPQLTNAVGGFSFPVLGLLENSQLRVVTVGKPEEVSSPVVLESIAVRVSFHAHSTGRRGYVRLYGTVAPAEVGALVGFQLLKPGHKSINQGGAVVKTGTPTVSQFSRVVRVHPGLYRALVKISDGAHVSNYSNPVLVR